MSGNPSCYKMASHGISIVLKGFIDFNIGSRSMTPALNKVYIFFTL